MLNDAEKALRVAGARRYTLNPFPTPSNGARMDLFVYEIPDGQLADFRAYLDGFDHAFDDHRPLRLSDPRQEKIRGLRHPRLGYELAGKLRFVGLASVHWRELMMFPILWDGDVEPVEWHAPAPASGATVS